ncbi:hypothetical protein R1CP_19630 [Rhodococcus opacus]|uniref:Uncharacterized protein n=1 Tax=Rhodococcus opacus TaxID=37919 RepID=A0A1B1K7S7_RHOOP|nr:hypothetical protein R1CP_19630 [Rhodococcus opacus]
MTRVGAEALGELFDLRDAVVAALGDEVGGTELSGQGLTVGVSAPGDDALRAGVFGGENGEQSHRAVSDDCEGLPRAGLGGDGGEPPGAEDVGSGQQMGGLLRGRLCPGGHEGPVGQRDTHVLRLGADRSPRDGVHAAALVAGSADLTGVVGGEGRPDDEVADFYAPYLVADLLDDADGLVAHRLRPLRLLDAAVGPQVGTADAGGGDADDRVGRFEDGRVVTLVDTNVAGGAHHNSTHE